MALTDADIKKLKNSFKDTFATKNDLTNLTTAFNIALGGLKTYIDERFSEAFRLLPTKEEFFSRMDKLSCEYKKIDEAETLHTGTMSDHADTLENHDQRIAALENRKTFTPAPISFPNM